MAVSGIYAVLTGDIVDSSGLKNINHQPVSALIQEAGNWVKNHFQTEIHAQIDIFRGDSWQLVVREPAVAVRVGLYFRTVLRGFYGMDSRMSIGFGSVDYLPSENISTGSGQAFRLSGQGLETTLKPTRMSLNFGLPETSREGQGLKTIIRLIDLQVGRWTASQSQAVAGAIIGLTQADIAANWRPDSISQQAISQHLDSAGWSQIKSALDYMEKALPEILSFDDW